ncbi:hypothetical protein K431DRAFT_313826 [Polychaeton citri CBS 116435]|uniref:Uncharacterized protein n=1 Tax=Polychaeton citri CBS 116435 TaxID=1314669 RepID=A0A9P4UL86_9PEZI|nr:hypothetical protein K431DRAFT_313826 [Polychaeton citri CBS 116435]
MSAQSPLQDRDTNQKAPTQMKGTQQERKIMEQKIAENNKNGEVYISPSDAILSPASQKLSSFKQRQMNKKGGPNPVARSLFSKSLKNNENNRQNTDGL